MIGNYMLSVVKGLISPIYPKGKLQALFFCHICHSGHYHNDEYNLQDKSIYMSFLPRNPLYIHL